MGAIIETRIQILREEEDDTISYIIIELNMYKMII